MIIGYIFDICKNSMEIIGCVKTKALSNMSFRLKSIQVDAKENLCKVSKLLVSIDCVFDIMVMFIGCNQCRRYYNKCKYNKASINVSHFNFFLFLFWANFIDHRKLFFFCLHTYTYTWNATAPWNIHLPGACVCTCR